MATSNVKERGQEQAAPILVAAALGRELAPLKRASHPALALVETGEGVRNAERVIGSWLERRSVAAVLSIGFAGALSPSLEAGDIVVAREVRAAGGGESFSLHGSSLLDRAGRLRVEGLRINPGVAVTVDEVVCEAKAKRALARSLAPDEVGCVDMESLAVARLCRERSVPLVIIRAITDGLDEDLPVDFNRCRDRRGRVSSMLVMRAALARPRSFRGLWRLKHRSDLCAERLALFVKHLASALKEA